MTDSDLSGDSSSVIPRNVRDVKGLETVLRGACQQLEESIVAWIVEMNLVQATLRGARRARPMLDAAERLARLEDALRVAPDHFRKQLRERLGAMPLEPAERKTHEGPDDDVRDRDLLTGLFNRVGFETELAREILAARDGLTGAMLLIDLDHFRDVNDRVGHMASDDLIKAVADALKHRIRRTDILARVGGDQFAVILPQTDGSHARTVADGIVKAFRRGTAFVDHQVVCPTASVGVVLFDSLSTQVLSCSELALYQAKEAGGDQFAMYGIGMDRGRASARVDELNRIHQALDEERLLLYCQPIVDLASNQVSQYELLLRLEMEEGATPLSPADFLGIAERFGMIQSIDCWVIRRAIALLADRKHAERPLILHVNVSAKSIGDPEFAAITEEALAEAAIDPAHLVLELTETGAITNLEHAKSFTSRLRKIGCRFALDDFGAGFGSFYNLKYLPFDLLKIDGDFIRNLGVGQVDQLVVNAIVTIARSMGKKTVAEFVESAETSRLLRNSGVDYGQGYYLGRPRPVDDVLSAPSHTSSLAPKSLGT